MIAAPASTNPLASYVGGQWRLGPSEVPVVNPANPAEVVATTSRADADAANDAVVAAAESAAAWRRTPAPARAEVLRGAAELVDARAATISRDLTREEGKTVAESEREVRLAAQVFRYFAGQAFDPAGATYPSRQPEVLLYTRHEPLGVVSVITPWNFPVSIPAWKLAPALVFGNTVVWKPAEAVPRTAVHLVEALVDAGLPEGVVNLVLGRGSDVGDVLVTHPAVAAVTFTGSDAVGVRLRERAAQHGKKVQLEMGGKNPAIVLGDADLKLAARQISVGAFGGTGQKCTATSRVIVEAPVLEELVDLLCQEAESWVLGDPLDPATTMGPLASEGQLTTVLGYLETAARQGAQAAAGGGRAGGRLAEGYFVPATVLVDVEPDHVVAREEIFGPVAAVFGADTYEEAISLANDTPYGLTASLFTSNLTTALRFADEIRAGIVKINQGTSGTEYHVPFGGTKASGHGPREQGKAARDFFTESKTVYLDPAIPPDLR